MTHEVVPSDVDYAQRLLRAGCDDGGVVCGLRWRGVAEKEATDLVLALRHGQTVRLSLPSGARLVPRDRIAEAREASNTPRPPRLRRRRHRLASNSFSGKDGHELQAVVLFLAVVGGLVWLWTTDFGTVPGREHSSSAPFVKTDEFDKRAEELTNSVAH